MSVMHEIFQMFRMVATFWSQLVANGRKSLQLAANSRKWSQAVLFVPNIQNVPNIKDVPNAPNVPNARNVSMSQMLQMFRMPQVFLMFAMVEMLHKFQISKWSKIVANCHEWSLMVANGHKVFKCSKSFNVQMFRMFQMPSLA